MMQPFRSASDDVDVETAHARQQAGAIMLDVREPGEWAMGSPIGAVRIPMGEVSSRFPEEHPDRGREVLAICAVGARSARVAHALRALGYARAVNVAGGFNQWRALGLPFETPSALDADARERYSRHLLLPEIGERGQERLGQARVLVVGAGGLGSPAAFYLAAAGVGCLRIVDDDRIERSNLQRQVLHQDARVGAPKVASAQATLRALNPRVSIEAAQARIDAENVAAALDGVDVVVDGADNFATRYVLNDACIATGLPLVYGAVQRFEGQASVFWPGHPSGEAPCYRCLFPEPPSAADAPNCAEAGVLGVVPGMIGLIQANETLKLILGIGEPLIGRVLCVDALGMRFRELRLARDPGCPGCGPNRRPVDLPDANCAAR